LIIQPGVEQPSVANMIELVRTSSKRRVDITIQDEESNPVDIVEEILITGDPKGELDLQITDQNNNLVLNDVYFPDPTGSSRVSKQGNGKYGLTYGLEDGETDKTGVFLFNWHARIDDTSEDFYRTQILEVVSPRTLSLLPTFRLMIDKVVKKNLPEKYCFLGYTDGMLVMFLKLGLHMINEYEPYPMWRSLEEFPLEYNSQILIKAALYQGLTSQTLFAIDTDVPSYSDQGHSFVLQHANPLAAFVGRLSTELDKIIPIFKKKFVNSGTLGVEAQLNAAYYMLLNTSPYGTIYKNLFANS